MLSGESRSWLKRLLRPTWKERKRMLYLEAWVFIVSLYVLAVFAFLFPQDFRNRSPFYVAAAWTACMIQAFLVHFGFIVVVITVVAVCRRLSRMVATTLPLLLVSTGPTLWDYRPKWAANTQHETVTVMSVNLLMVNRTTDPIIDEIRRCDPEILLLQEYTDHWHRAMQQAFGATYPHIAYVARNDSFGAAIYSRRSFIGQTIKYVPLADATEPQIRVAMEIAGRQVAIYNVHLLPPRTVEYTTISRLQFADLLDRVASEPLPVILSGDFNFTERSPQAAALKGAGLNDGHSVGGWGRGATWPVISFLRWLPGLRLDHIYLSSGLTCVECHTGRGEGSDHRPVIARVGFVHDD